MKTQLMFALAALIATPAFAADEVKLMQATMYSGYTMPQYSYSVNCDISSGHTLVKTRQGANREETVKYNETTYTTALPNKAAVTAALKKAAKGRIQEGPAPVDGPSQSFVGILVGKVSDLHIRLSGMNGGNGTYFENTADGVRDLVEFGAANCPTPRFER